MFYQTLFIVWRESIEALLIIGILQSWLSNNADQRGLSRPLWFGVLAGLFAAMLMAGILLQFSASLPPEGQDYFQAGMVFTASALIVHMVMWMRREGANLKSVMQSGLSTSAQNGKMLAVFSIAAIAVAREGAETVIFLIGVSAASTPSTAIEIGLAFVSAFALAALTYGALQFARHHMPWRWFFAITEYMLLLLGCAMFVKGFEYLISIGILPYTDVLWDSAWLLDDFTRFGSIVAGLTGYRSAPDVITTSSWAIYWAVVALLMSLIGNKRLTKSTPPKQNRPVSQG